MSDDIWENDQLGRERHSAFIYALVTNRMKKKATNGSFVVNVDAKWGQGKTYFIDRMYRQVLQQGHPAIFINAWKYDYIDDPYTHVVAEVDRYFKELINQQSDGDGGSFKKTLKTYSDAVITNAGKIVWTGLKGGAKRVSRWAIAEGADEIVELVEHYTPSQVADAGKGVVEDVQAELTAVNDKFIDAFIQKRIDDFAETKNSLENFQTSLTCILELLGKAGGKQLPMFVFIDELDRCRPTYAISMLERIKHLFDIPNIAFIIATDTESLSASIKAVYGSEFDSTHYLGRFFNRSFKLPEGATGNIVRKYLTDNDVQLNRLSIPGVDNGWDGIAQFISKTAKVFDLSVRRIEQSLNILDDIIDATDPDYTIELTFLYTLICQFIADGEITEPEFMNLGKRVTESKVDWSYVDDQGQHSFQTLVSKVNEIKLTPIQKAFDKYQDEMRRGGSTEMPYLYGLLRAQLITKTQKGDAGPTEYSSYPWLISYAYNSLISDQDDQAGTD